MDHAVFDQLDLGDRRGLKKTISTALEKLTAEDGISQSDPETDGLLSGAASTDQQLNAKALQNRDRSRQAYVMQMQKIAANPDYDRVSASKSADAGAPMVFVRGQSIPSDQSGKKEVITMADGKGGTVKIPAVYAVVEADSAIASHDASGGKVDEYGGDSGVMALNNGRTAALKRAYSQGTADNYREALKADTGSHGVDATAIDKMKAPVLVRVFSESSIAGIDDPGSASNISAGAQLSASEQAESDAKRLDESVVMQYAGGDVNNVANQNFVRAFIATMGGSDAAGDMVTGDGMISASGIKRIEGALVAKAYGDQSILSDLTENPDDDLKSLGNVLKDVAGRWSVMTEAAKGGSVASAVDITKNLTDAIVMIRKARQQGVRLSELVNQDDMFSGAVSPVTEQLLRLMFKGDDFNRVRSADKIKKALHGFLDKAMATTEGADMFGHKADPIELIEQQKGMLETEENAHKAQKGLFDSIADYLAIWTHELGVFDSLDEAAKAVDTNPSAKKKESGNYRKGHANIHGLKAAIENPKGSKRTGTDKDGNHWESTMNAHYGYFKGSRGADGDEVDVFFGADAEKPEPGIFVVNQNHENGDFDEHKVMFGYPNETAAKAAYLGNYDKGWTGLGSIKAVGLDEFRKWLFSDATEVVLDSISPLGALLASPEARGLTNSVSNFIQSCNKTKSGNQGAAINRAALHSMGGVVRLQQDDYDDSIQTIIITHANGSRFEETRDWGHDNDNFYNYEKLTGQFAYLPSSDNEITDPADEYEYILRHSKERTRRELKPVLVSEIYDSLQGSNPVPMTPVLDSVQPLSLLERRNLKKSISANVEIINTADLGLMALRKLKAKVSADVERLNGEGEHPLAELESSSEQLESDVEPSDTAYADIEDMAVAAVQESEYAMLMIKANDKESLVESRSSTNSDDGRVTFHSAVMGAVAKATDEPKLAAEAISIFADTDDDENVLLRAVYTKLKAKADAMEAPIHKEEPKPEPDTLDDRINKAIANGVVLSDADLSKIRSMHESAAELQHKANQLSGMDSHLDGVKKSFHLGMVGGSGRNNKSLNRRREKSMDKSIDNAKKALSLFNSADSKILAISKMLEGKGTEKDVSDKAIKREKSKKELAHLANTLKKGDKIAGKEVVRVTKDKAGYPSKFRYVDPESFDPVLEFWRIGFASKEEFHDYIDRARAESAMETGDSQADEVVGEEPLARLTIPTAYTHDFHIEMRNTIRENMGLVSILDIQRAFKLLASNEEKVKELLKKKKNKDLERIASPSYRNERKDQLVRGAYSAMLSSFGYFNSDSLSYGFGEGALQAAVKANIDKLTQEELIAWADDEQKQADAYRARREKLKKALEEPETLEDFETIIRVKGKDDLSPEELVKYDELKAKAGIDRKQDAASQKAEERATLQGAESEMAHEYAQTTHAKKGIPLYVVRMTGDRLEKTVFYDLAGKAKKLGGWYSKFSKNGAIPGFQFTSEEDREKFAKLLKGESVDNTENQLASEEDRQESRIKKLIDMAESMEARANEKLNQDRKTNTSRRASMAASVENDARTTIAYAKTLREVAEKIKTGEVQFLANLSQQSQLSVLYSETHRAARDYISNNPELKQSNWELQRDASERLWNGEATQQQINEMMVNIKMPWPKATPADLMRIADKIESRAGYKLIAGRLRKLAGNDRQNDKTKDARKIPLDVAAKLTKLEKKLTANSSYGNSFLPWHVPEALANHQRLTRMGVDSDEHLRAALRELMSLKQQKDTADPMIELERSLIGKYKDLEWFNTPDAAASQLVGMADLNSSHKILEPSAGLGHLADAAVSMGIPRENIHTVEIASKLAEGLKLKGYEVVHEGDFLSYNKGGYDRIIMNPPFSGDKDIEHVLHAFKLLAPGGRLVAIVSGMTGDRQNNKNQGFREFLDEHGIDEQALPEGSFKGSINSTGVNTKIISLMKSADLSTSERAEAESTPLPDWIIAGSPDDMPAEEVQTLSHEEFENTMEAVQAEKNPRIRMLFLEAKRYNLPDTDIQSFLTGELSEGTNAMRIRDKIESLKMKYEAEREAAMGEGDEQEAEEVSATAEAENSGDPDFIPTHATSDGTDVIEHPDEPGVYVDAYGNEIEDEWATPLPDKGEAKPEPEANEPLPEIEYMNSPVGGKNFGRINEQAVGVKGLKDWPIRLLSTGMTEGLGARLGQAGKTVTHGGGSQTFVYFAAKEHSKIYKRGEEFYLQFSGNKGAGVLKVRESEHGSFYQATGGLGSVKGTSSADKIEAALSRAKLIWEYKADQPENTITLNRKEYAIYGAKGESSEVVAIALPNQSQIDAFYAYKNSDDGVSVGTRKIKQWITEHLLPEGEIQFGEDHRKVNALRKALGLWSDADDKADIPATTEKEQLAKSSALNLTANEEEKKPTTLASSITSEDQVTGELSDGMNDSLDPNSEDYKYRDTGYVAGAAKEKAAERIKVAKLAGELVRSKDIDWSAVEDNPREASQLITKANLLGKPDWEDLRSKGMTPQAAFLIDKLYRSIAVKPDPDTAQARKAFVTGLESIRDRLESKKTAEEVIDLLWDEIRPEMTQLSYTDEELAGIAAANKAIEAARLKLRAVKEDYGWQSPESQQVAQEIRALIKERDAISAKARERNENEASPLFVWNSMGKRFQGAVKRRSKSFVDHLNGSLNGKPDNWDWAIKETGNASGGEKKPKASRFKLVVSNNYERVGGRDTGIDSTTSLKNNFGLRDVQSGNWVLRDKESAKFHVQRSAEAFADLADVLGVDDKRVSMGGKLAIAFGARGHGGALAHYEPVQRVINMTKMSGGGSLAHEWFHAFDNLLFEFMGEGTSGATHEAFLTENPDMTAKPAVKAAFENLRDAMDKGDVKGKITIKYTERDVSTAAYNIKPEYRSKTQAGIRDAGDFQKAIDFLETISWGRKQKVKRDWYRMAAAYHGGAGKSEMTATAGTGKSKFFRDAEDLDGSKKKAYWASTLEMAARAFSAYVEDKLREDGRKNDYLSNHSSNSIPDYVSSGAMPFPEGDERVRINAAFDALFKALKDDAIFDSLMEVANRDINEAVFD